MLGLAAAGCTPQNQSSPPAAGQVGEEPPALYTPPSTTHPPPLKNGKVDPAQSQALTEYFKAHHLPLVGAQVLSAPDGQKQVILFGYVRTDYGKGDAESRAKRYVKDPNATVDNRIKIEPSLANLNPSQSPDNPAASANDDDMAGLDQYQSQQYEDQLLQQQQMQAYQSNGGMGMPLGILGLFGGMGGGGLSFGGGSFGGGFGSFGGYGGYPPYGASPPPSYNYPPPSYYP